MSDDKKDDKKLDKIENKIDAIAHRINAIDVTLAAQHESLKDHIRRTELLEAQVEPIKEHVDGLKGVVHFLKILAVLAAIAESLHILWH